MDSFPPASWRPWMGAWLNQRPHHIGRREVCSEELISQKDSQITVRRPAEMEAIFYASWLAFLLISSSALGQDPGKIRVLGPAKGHEATVLISWFTAEPSIDAVVIPTRSDVWAGVSNIHRYMRIYFPRSYKDLLRYEFIILAQVDLSFFTDQQQRWVYDALSEGGRGGVNTRSVMSALASYNVLWRESIISKAFPNDVDAILSHSVPDASGAIMIADDPQLPDIMKSFKPFVEPIFTRHGGVATMPKPGAVILSYVKDPRWTGPPEPGHVAHAFYWDWNGSMTFTFMDMVTSDFWGGGSRWNPYALDMITNVVWFSTGRDLPGNPLEVHQLRMNLYTFRLRRSILVSLIDFAEKFGANPSKVYLELDRVDSDVREGENLYLKWEFDEAGRMVSIAVRELGDLEADAAKLKDAALLWVYLLDWLATAGVSLLAGFLLWSLMVRRSLYRAVSTTRMR